MYDHGMMGPVLALVAWTLVVWVWMFATRIPAMQKAKLDLSDPKMKAAGLKGMLPPSVETVGNNYNHLHEQPTIFYAAAIAIQLAGFADPFAIGVAWFYVISRVVHSIVQNTFNHIMTRFFIFVLGSLALMVLVGRTIANML